MPVPARTGCCPPIERLEACLDQAADAADVRRHLEGCRACRELLEELRGNNDLLARLTSWSEPRSPPSPPRR